MRTCYARREDALTLASGERVIGIIQRPAMLTEYVVGECPPAVTIRNLRRILPSSLLAVLAAPNYHRGSDADSWQWAPPEARRSRRRSRLTHAGRERKRARG
jgi:hypothetical protein